MIRISSVTIAELTNKQHCDICKHVRDAFRSIGVSSFRVEGTYKDSQNQEHKCFYLSRSQWEMVLGKYPIKVSITIPDILIEAEKHETNRRKEMELVKSEQKNQDSEVQTMSSLEIAKLTGKRHKHVCRDIKNTMEQAGIDATRFARIYKDSMNREQTCYHLPRRECDLVMSGYSVKYRLIIIDRWIELEKEKAAGGFKQIPVSRRELAQMVLDQETEKDRLVCQVEGLQEQALCLHEQTTLDAPKVQFADTVICDDEDIDFNTYAKLISLKHGIIVGQNKLMGYCRLVGYLQSGRNTYERNKPHQKWIERGYFSVKYNWIKMPQGREQVVQTFVTPKGQQALLSEILCEFSDRAIESVVSKQERISNDFHDGFIEEDEKGRF